LRRTREIAAGHLSSVQQLADGLNLDHRKDTSMSALQAHYIRRDVMSWKPLLDQYKAATGDGVSH
jgi:hypothetical protein